MTRSKDLSWLAVEIAAVAGFTLGVAHAASAASADETAIRAQTTNWMKAYNGRDAKSVATLYADSSGRRCNGTAESGSSTAGNELGWTG